MKERIFISDSNETLTKSRQPIRGEMADVLVDFANRYRFVVISGSPWHEIKDQMPPEIIANPNIDFWCNMGNILYRDGKEIQAADKTVDFSKFEPILQDIVKTCPYQFYKKYNNHFEVTAHAINFTMLGRPLDGEPPLEDRNDYEAWDESVGQRRWIINYLEKLYSDYEFTLGGQISIDIVKKGYDKSRIVDYYKDYDIAFFGDRIAKHGNDNTLAHKIADIGGTIYSVDSVDHTMNILKEWIELDKKEKGEA